MPSIKLIPKGELCLRNVESSKEVVGGEFLVLGGQMVDGGSQLFKGAVGNSVAVSVERVALVFILVFHIYPTVILVDSSVSPQPGASPSCFAHGQSDTCSKAGGWLSSYRRDSCSRPGSPPFPSLN